jgi:hypothetical protein
MEGQQNIGPSGFTLFPGGQSLGAGPFEKVEKTHVWVSLS